MFVGGRYGVRPGTSRTYVRTVIFTPIPLYSPAIPGYYPFVTNVSLPGETHKIPGKDTYKFTTIFYPVKRNTQSFYGRKSINSI